MAQLATDIPLELVARINELAANAPRLVPIKETDKPALIARIKALLAKHRAQLVAHYYVDADLQALAEATGGVVADSLEMANFGAQSDAEVLIVCGVRFMGETAKMLSPEKTVLMPDLNATCSLDVGCPSDEFAQFCAQHPDRKVVVYANTSVEVKALADWVVTSGNALAIARHLKAQGEKIIWAPDQHLGHWIEQETGIDMIRWMGHCIVHDEFKAFELEQLKQQYSKAKVLVHPESAAAVVALADVVGSTKVLINAVQSMPDAQFIVATDQGIFYKMQQLAPNKQLIVAPTDSKAKQCISCANCPWMGMNGLENLVAVLEALDQDERVLAQHEIRLDEQKRQQALVALNRMLEFSRQQGLVASKPNTKR